jgi:ATP-binding cassette subfamily F protein 3
MASIAPAHVDSPFRFSFEDLDPGTHQLISLERLSAGYGDHRVIERISHGLLPGDKLGLLGPNGAGKSTLVKVLAGDQQDLLGDSHLPEGQPDILSGQRHSVKTLRVGYFAQHQVDQLRLDWSPLQHLQNLDPSAREQQLRGYLGGFGFSGDMATEPVGPRSGGEKARLVLAILVYRKPNVLLLDEPTNHLDLDMRLALNLALQSFAGALVLVSHDRHLLRSLCDSFLLVADGQAVPWAGDLDDYARWLSERRRASEAATKPATGNSVLTRHARTRRKATASLNAELRPLRQRLRHIEKNMDFLQKQKDDLDDEMAAPELYDQSPDKVAALGERHGRITAELEDLEMAWLEVSEAIEALSG